MSLAQAGYAPSTPFDEGYLPVGDIHQLFYQQYGKKDGKPVIFLHGGPGGRTSSSNTIYFDPAVYRIVLLDQRGAGKSLPPAELRDNTTWHLVADIESLREHLGIDKWHMVFGGSWGSTLALCYAQAHPQRVGSLVLRGIFTMRRCELEWSRRPAAQLFPDLVQEFINYIPEDDRADPYVAYHRLLMAEISADDEEARLKRMDAARAWDAYALATGCLQPNTDKLNDQLEDEASFLAHARLEYQYFVNAAWLEEGQLLRKENLDKMRHIPTTIVQGRYDLVCPPKTAWDLHQALPESRLYFIQTAGHSAKEPATAEKLVQVCDEYGKLDF